MVGKICDRNGIRSSKLGNRKQGNHHQKLEWKEDHWIDLSVHQAVLDHQNGIIKHWFMSEEFDNDSVAFSRWRLSRWELNQKSLWWNVY